MNSRVLGVGEFNNTIGIFTGLNEVAMATKFKQKSARDALNSVMCKKWRLFCT